jgi:hypothetical protein
MQGEVERLLRAGKAELSPELKQLQDCLRPGWASGVSSLRASLSPLVATGCGTHRCAACAHWCCAQL